jgi:hypothetical protein
VFRIKKKARTWYKMFAPWLQNYWWQISNCELMAVPGQSGPTGVFWWNEVILRASYCLKWKNDDQSSGEYQTSNSKWFNPNNKFYQRKQTCVYRFYGKAITMPYYNGVFC